MIGSVGQHYTEPHMHTIWRVRVFHHTSLYRWPPFLHLWNLQSSIFFVTSLFHGPMILITCYKAQSNDLQSLLVTESMATQSKARHYFFNRHYDGVFQTTRFHKHMFVYSRTTQPYRCFKRGFLFFNRNKRNCHTTTATTRNRYIRNSGHKVAMGAWIHFAWAAGRIFPHWLKQWERDFPLL